MKTIQIKSLTLINFKGIKKLTVEFPTKATKIYGYNRTGKTTIMDSFIWLLFGKDSTDRKNFEIKTLDSKNRVIAKLDHEVSAVLDIDGVNITIKRCFHEKWQKRRGSEESEFTGNETLFYVDDVPMQAGEYQAKINSIMDELVFKMVTSPHYFNSMKWEDKRQVLISLVGDVKDSDIAATKQSFQDLLIQLVGKSFNDFRRSISEKKRRLKDDLNLIPARIDEVTRQKPQAPDYNALSSELAKANTDLSLVDGQLTDSLKVSESVLEKEKNRQSKIYALKGQLSEIEFNAGEKANAGTRETDSKIRAIKIELDETERSIEVQNSAIKSNDLKIEYTDQNIVDLRRKWNEENEKQITFDENAFNCPTCKRPYETSDVEAQKEEMTANFNRDKLEKLKRIQGEGIELTGTIKSLKDDNSSRLDKLTLLKDKKAELEKELSGISAPATGEVNINEDPEYIRVKGDIVKLETETYKAPDNSYLRNQKSALISKIDQIKTELSVKETIEKLNARITELETETRTKSQELANLEKIEFTMTEFERTKMDLIEGRVNKMFSTVQFKMFNQLINGGTEPTCETLIDGVSWADANNAGRINGGIDIINTLCEYYNVSAPIFIDNSEAVCDLLPSVSQMIELVVSKMDKTLRLESVKESE